MNGKIFRKFGPDHAVEVRISLDICIAADAAPHSPNATASITSCNSSFQNTTVTGIVFDPGATTSAWQQKLTIV